MHVRSASLLTAAFLAALLALPLCAAPKTDPADPVDKPAEADKADKPAPPAAADEKIELVHPNDTTALKERMGKEIAVEGQVKSAAWSGTGKVMNIEFTEATDSKFFAAAFVKFKPALDAGFGGDVAKAINGKRVRVTGVLKDYKGRPEIMLEKPEQLEVLPADPTEGKPEKK